MTAVAGLTGRIADVVTRRPALVIAVMVVLTAGVAVGMTQLNLADQTNIDTEVFESTEVGQALEYTNARYPSGEDTAVSSVYVRPADGNALSRSSLVTALSYQQAVTDDPAVASELAGDPAVVGPPTFIGRHLAGSDASLDAQRAAIEAAGDAELAEAIAATFGDPDRAGRYLPRTYEPGGATAESMRIQFSFERAGVTQQQEPLPDSAAQEVLFETAQATDGMFTMGQPAQADWSSQQITDVFWLIVPPAFLLVAAVLAIAYRDLVDVVLGIVGVGVSLVWFFGILGWLGTPAGFASIVGPILIVALSIDFGLHVFMRYREQRGPEEGVRPAMYRSSRSVMIAFLLVAVTAGVGFMANVTTPIGFIRAFGVVIALGVLAAVFVFVTLVPALKVSVDAALERRGIDRRLAPLGSTGGPQRLLSAGVTLARRGAVAVVIVAVLAGGLGLVAYTDLDRQGFQEDFVDDDDWQTALPEPIGWSAHETEYRQHLGYVRGAYQSNDDRERATSFLIRGDVTEPATVARVQVGVAEAREREITFLQGGVLATRSPLSLIERHTPRDPDLAAAVAGLAARDDSFAAVLAERAEENSDFAASLRTADPAPGAELTDVYDALYAAAPAEAATVLERTDDGRYESMRLIVPIEQDVDINERGTEVRAIADAMETDAVGVVAVDFATVSNAGLGEIADSILWSMLLAFGGVAAVLAAMYRLERGTATLGIVTVVPIVLVVGFMFAGMYVAGIPLTFVTAFLVSITIGLGIDYNIHISDRFAQELAAGRPPVGALTTTVRGTGGALFGSALTSGASFATLLVHPSVVFQSFGGIVVLALVLSFVLSVLLLPSFLLPWARWQTTVGE